MKKEKKLLKSRTDSDEDGGVDKDGVMGDTLNTSDVVFEESEEEGSHKAGAEKIKKIRAELAACRKEKEEYLALCQRARADLVNARNESEKRCGEMKGFGEERVILDIIPVLDSFDQAMGNTEAWEKTDEKWRKGVEYIHSQLLSVLGQYGCTSFSPEGETFDPARHDPIENVAVSKEKDDHHVVSVLQRGYERNGKVIRPAKVRVGEFKK